MPIHNVARLRLPRPALGSCIYLGVERDTRALKLSDEQRFNHYPATPLPTISWVFDGQLHLVDADPSDGVTFTAALPALTFSGPRLQPTSSWSPAPVHAMTVAFYPDALYKLFKIRANDFTGRTVPLSGVLEGPLLDRFIEVGQAGEMDPFLRLEESLQTIWNDTLGSAALPTLRAWVQSMAVRAMFQPAGRPALVQGPHGPEPSRPATLRAHRKGHGRRGRSGGTAASRFGCGGRWRRLCRPVASGARSAQGHGLVPRAPG
jgi:hypothetical protein